MRVMGVVPRLGVHVLGVEMSGSLTGLGAGSGWRDALRCRVLHWFGDASSDIMHHLCPVRGVMT
ncbi:hypothetical protein BIU98_09525 [Curtobacterium sp. MMLR14_010]|nr:hypothetical protein BIU98_09525 [Curtobacterium sp. MMLR14_010]